MQPNRVLRLVTLVLLLAGASAAVAQKTTVACPIDGTSFNYESPPSDPIRGRDLDMKPVASYPTPWPLPKCPASGFVVYKHDRFSEAELAKLRPFVASERYQAMVRIHTSYYLAAMLRREAGDPAYDVAWSLAQATWEVSDDPARYKAYAQEALAAFNSLHDDSQLDRRQHVLREMISGELERRLGMFGAAEKRFRRIRDEAEFATPQLQHVIEFQLRLIGRKEASTRRMPS